MDSPEFAADIAWTPPDILSIHVSGYMGSGAETYLDRVADYFRSATVQVRVLFVVTDTFTGFHSSQVMLHGRFFTRHRARLRGIAVANAPNTVSIAASTVAAVTRIRVRSFADTESAKAWLRNL